MKTVSFCLLWCLSSVINAQSDTLAIKIAQTISKDDLEKHLSVLASDEFEGRETGKIGQKLAAKYIADFFKEKNLIAIDDDKNYYQTFNLIESKIEDVKINDGVFLKDFYGFDVYNNKKITTELVFAGYGIDTKNYSDYKNIDVKGKIVFVLPGEPLNNGKSLVTNSDKISEWSLGWDKKIKEAQKQGAVALFTIPAFEKDAFENRLNKLKHYLEKPEIDFITKDTTNKSISNFYLNPEFAFKLLKTNKKRIEKEMARIDKNISNYFSKIKNQPITLQTSLSKIKLETENVVGMIEGDEKKDEYIVISAHYDHIGVINGEIYNGADDDGTGTSAILEIAEAFSIAKQMGITSKRSILFIAMTGEEKGLLGSSYYVQNPLKPLEKTISNLNIDMIGRVDKGHENNSNYIYLIGSNMLSNDLHNISEQANNEFTKLELDYKYNDINDANKFYYRSDHYNFAKHNIPVIFYFSGIHEDYHKSTDTIDKIDFLKTEKITKLIFHTAWKLSENDERPKLK